MCHSGWDIHEWNIKKQEWSEHQLVTWDEMKLIFGLFYFSVASLDASLNSLKPWRVEVKGDSVNNACYGRKVFLMSHKAPEAASVVIVCVSLFTLHFALSNVHPAVIIGWQAKTCTHLRLSLSLEFYMSSRFYFILNINFGINPTSYRAFKQNSAWSNSTWIFSSWHCRVLAVVLKKKNLKN